MVEARSRRQPEVKLELRKLPDELDGSRLSSRHHTLLQAHPVRRQNGRHDCGSCHQPPQHAGSSLNIVAQCTTLLRLNTAQLLQLFTPDISRKGRI